MVPCNSLLKLGVFLLGEKEMIRLEDRPTDWIYYKIKVMEDYDLRKILSEELIKREVDYQEIDEDAYRIALSFQNFEILNDLRNSPNPFLAALAYQELENRINNSKIKKYIYPEEYTKKIKRRK